MRQTRYAVLTLASLLAPVLIYGQSQTQPGTENMNDMQGMKMDTQESAPRTGAVTPIPDYLKEAVQRAPMSLEDFEQMALGQNPTLRQADALARVSVAQAKQAGLWSNPSVGYEGDQIRGGSYGGGEQGGFVQQTIPLGGKLGLRRNVFTQEEKANRIGIDEQKARVKADIAQAYYQALAMQAEVEMRGKLLGVASDAATTAHQLANVGQADAPDILQSEVEEEQAKLDYAASQRSFIQSFQMLAVLAGNATLPVTRLKGDLAADPGIQPEQMVQIISENSPQVKRIDQEVAVAEARLKSAKREVVPDLTLRAGEQYNGETVAENPTKAAGAQSFASAEIKLPLWNRNQGNIKAAQAELEQAQAEALRVRLVLESAAQPLVQQYLTAQLRAERYRTELLPRSARAYQLYLNKYQEMASAYPQVLVSQRTYFQLQVDYIHTLGQLWGAATALNNFTLSGGLQRPAPSGSMGSGSSSPD
jgi:outer membrane protein, heavy metal efflux system